MPRRGREKHNSPAPGTPNWLRTPPAASGSRINRCGANDRGAVVGGTRGGIERIDLDGLIERSRVAEQHCQPVVVGPAWVLAQAHGRDGTKNVQRRVIILIVVDAWHSISLPFLVEGYEHAVTRSQLGSQRKWTNATPRSG